MKDWRDCNKITYHDHVISYDGKEYRGKRPDFKPCYKCDVKECKGKILIRAESRALRAISKI